MEGYIVLSILASIIMVLACINYMNIAVASAAYRLKEIGIRKVMGGVRKQLIYQFLSENAIVCLIAILLGILWTQIFFLPGFRSLIPNPLFIDFSDIRLWTYLAILFSVAVIGGAGYPALYISGFQPTAILRDKVRFGGKSMFRKVLLGMQYFFSFIAVIATIVLLQNDKYQRDLNWGYDKDDVIVVKVKGASAYDKLSKEIQRLTNVKNVAGSLDRIGSSTSEVTFEIDERRYTSEQLYIGWNLIETLGIKLVDGRSFDEDLESDRSQSVVVNQSFVKMMGWDDPLERSISIAEENFYVIGVVQDFHYRPFWAEIGSLILRVSPEEHFQYLSAQVPHRQLVATGSDIESIWRNIFPDDPYDFYYQDSIFDQAFQEYDMVTGVISTAGFIAIFLAMIGLFGLSALRIKSKLKEISIRKVLGGSWMELSVTLNREFVTLAIIASLIGIPASYFATTALLSTVTKFPMTISWLPFVITTFMLLLLSLVTVGGHVFKAITTNPSEALRTE